MTDDTENEKQGRPVGDSETESSGKSPAPTRRHLLKVIAALPATALAPLTPALARSSHSQKTHKPSNATPPSGQHETLPYKPKVLNSHQWKTVEVLSDLIIPADERSGSATQAGVPAFIDDWLNFKGGTLRDEIRGGLTWLDMECNRLFADDFADCSHSQQKQILDRIAYPGRAAPEDENAVAFFNQFRDLVVGGFYSSEMGVKDLPYLGNKFVAEWKGCPPDVLAKLGLTKET